MPRIRYLKPDFFKDEDIKDLSYEARLFYQGLWCIADKEGRLEDRPERLKVEIMPYDNIDVEKILSQLEQNKSKSNRPFIVRYKINGEKYIQILKWHEHQRIHHTEKESKIPPPNKGKSKFKGKGKSKAKTNKLEISNRELTVKEQLKDIYIIWDFYLKTFKDIYEPRKLSDNIKSKIQARLKEYSLEEIKEALTNMRNNEFLCGKNENGKVYAKPEYCFRNDEKIEEWLNKNLKSKENKESKWI